MNCPYFFQDQQAWDRLNFSQKHLYFGEQKKYFSEKIKIAKSIFFKLFLSWIEQKNSNSFFFVCLQDVFREVNEDTTLGSFEGRLFIIIYQHLVQGLFKKYNWNEATQRFVKSDEKVSRVNFKNMFVICFFCFPPPPLPKVPIWERGKIFRISPSIFCLKTKKKHLVRVCS